MPNYLEHLKAAISALEQELEHDPRYVALRDLRQIYAQGRGGDSVSDNTDSRLSLIAEPRRVPVKREMMPATRQAIDEAERFLAGYSNPVPLQQIYDQLIAQGCRIGGQKPVNSLSAILSRSGKFEAHGRSGWTIGPSEGVLAGPITEIESEAPAESKSAGASMGNGISPSPW